MILERLARLMTVSGTHVLYVTLLKPVALILGATILLPQQYPSDNISCDTGYIITESSPDVVGPCEFSSEVVKNTAVVIPLHLNSSWQFQQERSTCSEATNNLAAAKFPRKIGRSMFMCKNIS